MNNLDFIVHLLATKKKHTARKIGSQLLIDFHYRSRSTQKSV